MLGLEVDVVVHMLPLKEECPPVKKKLRRTRPDMSKKIKDEVQKQFDAGFLAVISYPPWVANIVHVPKKDGKVQMCVDYRDLKEQVIRMIFRSLTLTYWSTTPCSSQFFCSWTVSPVITKLKWPQETWRRLRLSHLGNLLLQSYAFWFEERMDNLPAFNGNHIP